MRISDLENIPFRVRIGVAVDCPSPDRAKVSEKIKASLEAIVFDLFDAESKKRIRAVRHTTLAYTFLLCSSTADRFFSQELLQLSNSKIEATPASSKQIIDHCDLLLLIGHPESFVDGNKTIAHAKREHRPMIMISALTPYEITIERGHGLYAGSISGIEHFNAFTVSEAEQQAYISNLCAGLFKEEYGLPEQVVSEVREQLLPLYVRASNLAKRNQKIYRLAAVLVYCFSALAVTAVAVGTLVHSLSTWAFSLELLLLISILGIVFYANQQRTHKRWIESRFLAERIRAAVFLAVCGVEASQITVPPYLGSPNQPDEWMVMTFNEIWSRLPPREGCANECCTALRMFVRERWIQNQIRFHEIKARESEKMSRWLERVGVVAFGLALAAAALHLFLSTIHVESFEKILILAAISLPAVGAAIGGIRTHREYSRLAKRSRNMATNLRKLDERFASANDAETLETLLHESERLVLLETQDWLMLMSFAKLETV